MEKTEILKPDHLTDHNGDTFVFHCISNSFIFNTIRAIFMIILFSTALFGAFERKGVGASTIALSLSGTASEYQSFAVFNNPALIENNVFFSEMFYKKFYGIKGFDLIAFAATANILSVPLGFGIARYGNNIFTETELVMGVSHNLHDHIIIGLSMSSYFLDIAGHGKTSGMGFSFSALYFLNNEIRIAGLLSNFNEPDLGKTQESIPVSGQFGIAYKPFDEVEFLFDGYKEDYYDFAYRFGVRIQFIEQLHLLSGFQNSIESFSVGFEFAADNYEISYGLDIHPALRSSQAIGFNYAF